MQQVYGGTVGTNGAAAAPPNYQQDILRRRLPFVMAALFLASIVLMVRLVLFQAPLDPRVAQEIERIKNSTYSTTLEQTAARGTIYDRNGQPMAVNTLLYRIGLSPNLISDPDAAVEQLSAILNLDPRVVRDAVNSDRSYVYLASNVDPTTWRRIAELDFGSAIVVEPTPRRYYPQGALASQVIGFVGMSADSYVGYLGVESYYQDQLQGRTTQQEISNIPFELLPDQRIDRGGDLVMTLDRDVQYLAESQLQQAITETGATAGTILVMNPRNGDILAMASFPTYDPNNYQEYADNPRLLQNPAIESIYEPGSVFKVLTVAAALENGSINANWTYNDTGQITIGGRTYPNWDGNAYGLMDVRGMLVNSLNVGAVNVALTMGRDDFYRHISAFRIGQPTRVDLSGEVSGILKVPNVSPDWSEADFGANSFGQGLAVTPLQMLSAINVIANDGLLMQPRIVSQIVRGGNITNLEPKLFERVLSPETANMVTDMMVSVVEDGLDSTAQLAGYSIAGKTGTAQIPNGLGQYETGDGSTIVSMVGFLPADDPQISILIKLDRPRTSIWASQVAAPVFRDLAEKLVLMMEIPTDEVRLELAAQGGVISGIDR
jgi:cell division protein FtsI (penicillin-binding protein 3)